jgi:two-component sensor histidine kinase
MTSGFFRDDILNGLAARVLFFLSLALLPIGLIAIVQTRDITAQYRINGELSLLAVTEQASSAERYVLQEAFGAADALGSIVLLHRNNLQGCSAFMRAYKRATDVYEVVGYIPVSGIMECSSADGVFDFSGTPGYAARIADPRERAEPGRQGGVTGQNVSIITSPVFDQGALLGYIALAIPHSAIDAIKEPDLVLQPEAFVTLNDEGVILTSNGPLAAAEQEMPGAKALSHFSGNTGRVFRAPNRAGVMRVYAVQPIVQRGAYALSVWPVDTPFLKPGLVGTLGSFVPIIMWIASLVVAFWALNRLALRHIRKLGRQMRRFALNRNLPRKALHPSVPVELRDMESAFTSMGESILRDEAQLEDSLREKNILLKEVHHRVKNNLQLISSIMNMQIRQADSDEAGRVLRRLQERILSLATVHKNLYQNDNIVRADAKQLLSEAVGQLLKVGLGPGSNVEVTQSYDEISFEADDAAPLTLLVSEAITNALKHVGGDTEEPGRLAVTMVKDGPEHALLTISNSISNTPQPDGTGLGSKLIHAFARQLNGNVEVTQTETDYTLALRFFVPQVARAVNDY